MSYKKELKEFREFKKNYNFIELNVTKKDNKIYCEKI